MQLFLGFLLALAIGIAAFRLHLLNRWGAASAALLGTFVFGLGGWEWALVLLGFFGSSSLLTRFLGRRKQDLNATFSKGGQRDAGQVLANGGLAGLAVLLHAAFPEAAAPWILFCGALAAANADTWATELGVLSRSAPRLITTLKAVPRGTSGGVSLAGNLAAVGGALAIATLAMLFWPGNALIPLNGGRAHAFSEIHLFLWAWVTAAGLAGSWVDSLLGATLQAVYRCPTCARETERHPLHTCGTPTVLVRGLAWLDNDGVNAACTAAGALLAVLFALRI